MYKDKKNIFVSKIKYKLLYPIMICNIYWKFFNTFCLYEQKGTIKSGLQKQMNK